MKLRKRDLFLLVAAPALMLGAIGTTGGIQANSAANEVYAADAVVKTATYTVASKTSVNTTGNAPTGSSATYAQTYKTTAGQMTKGNSSTLTVSGYGGYKITGITLSMRSNGSAGAGSCVIKVGATTIAATADKTEFNAFFDNTDYGTSYRTVTPTLTSNPVVGEGEKISIVIAASTNSLYVNGYTISWSATETPKHSVTLITNCEQTIDPFEVDEGGKISSIEGADSLSKKGYHLDGWTTDEKWRNKWHFDTDVVTEDVTLFADWVKDNAAEYTLTFDINKGSAAPAAQTVKEEHYFSTVEDPTKDSDDLYSYTFAGWYELDDNDDFLAEPFDFDTPATKDVELYAKWDAHLLVENETFFSDTNTQANLAFSYTATTTEAVETSTTITSENWGESGKTSVTNENVSISWEGAKADDMRVYANKSITVSSKKGKLKSIAFTCTGSGTSDNGPGKLSVKSGSGTYAYNGQVGTWTANANSNVAVTLKASKQVRITSIVVIAEGASTSTYSDFENVKLQFRYDLNSLSQGDKNKIKKAQEAGLFITDDENFDFTSKPTTLDVAEGKIGKKYHNVEGKDFDLTVGITIPEEKYGTELYAASYLLMPNGKYYFNKPKNYSVNSILAEYAYGSVLTDATQKAICVAFATSLGLTANN